jgi:hypothetical protein
MVAKLSRLLWAVLVFVAKPALADNVTYQQYSASSADWKRSFVFALAQYHTTINPAERPPYPTTRAFQRCLSGARMPFFSSKLRHTSQEIQAASPSQWLWLL